MRPGQRRERKRVLEAEQGRRKGRAEGGLALDEKKRKDVLGDQEVHFKPLLGTDVTQEIVAEAGVGPPMDGLEQVRVHEVFGAGAAFGGEGPVPEAVVRARIQKLRGSRGEGGSPLPAAPKGCGRMAVLLRFRRPSMRTAAKGLAALPTQYAAIQFLKPLWPIKKKTFFVKPLQFLFKLKTWGGARFVVTACKACERPAPPGPDEAGPD